MQPVTVAQQMTAEEYLAQPEDSWPRTQLIEGEVIMVESTPMHQMVAFDLASALREWRHGPRELWLVDTKAAEVLAFRRSTASAASFDVAVELARADALSSPLLPSFSLALGQLFADD